MRGSSFQYLFDWALVIFIVTIVLWTLKYLLAFILKKIKDKESKFFLVTKTIHSFFDETAIILLLVFTYNEIVFYGLASFKIISKKYSNSIDTTKLILSCLFFAYYIFYLFKLFLVSLKNKASKEHQKRYRLLYSCFQVTKLTRKICRIYLPSLLLRSLLIAILIVTLSSSAKIQSLLCLVTVIGWDIYSFFACPYRFYVRLFIRFHQLIFTIQIMLLCISAAFPQNSRLNVAVGLMVMNFLQVLVFLGLGISIILDKLFDIKCFKREQNVIKNLESEKQAAHRQKTLIQDTIQCLDQQNKQRVNKRHGQMLSDKSQGSVTLENIDVLEASAQKPSSISRKKYRVKRQNKF